MLGRRKNAGNESRRFVPLTFLPSDLLTVSVKTWVSRPLPAQMVGVVGLSGKCGHHCFFATAPAGQSLYWLVSFGPNLDSSVRKRKVVWISN